MSATTGAVWRTAGVAYIGYSRLCASMVRSCLKEPYKSEAAEVEKVHYSRSKWTDGKQPKPSKFLPRPPNLSPHPSDFILFSSWLRSYGIDDPRVRALGLVLFDVSN